MLDRDGTVRIETTADVETARADRKFTDETLRFRWVFQSGKMNVYVNDVLALSTPSTLDGPARTFGINCNAPVRVSNIVVRTLDPDPPERDGNYQDYTVPAEDFPAVAKNTVLFNGKDLSNWGSKSQKWNVDAGALVGEGQTDVARISPAVSAPANFELKFTAAGKAYGLNFGTESNIDILKYEPDGEIRLLAYDVKKGSRELAHPDVPITDAERKARGEQNKPDNNIPPRETLRYRLTVVNGAIEVYVNDKLAVKAPSSAGAVPRKFTFGCGWERLRLSDIQLRPLAAPAAKPSPLPSPATPGAGFLAKLKPEQTCDFEGALPEPPPGSAPYKLVDDPGPHGGKHVAIARQNTDGNTPIDWQPKPSIALKGKTRLMMSFRLSRPVEGVYISLDYMVDGQKCRAKCVRAFPPAGKWITASVPVTGEPLVVFDTHKDFKRRSAAGDMLLAVYNSAVVSGAEVEFRLDDLAIYEGEPGANGEDEWFEKQGSGWQLTGGAFPSLDQIADQIKNFNFAAALSSLDERLNDPKKADMRGHVKALREWVAALNAYEQDCEKGLARATGSLIQCTLNGKELRGTIVKSSGYTFSLAPAGGGQNIDVSLAALPAEELPTICGLDKTKPDTARMMALHAIFQRKFSIARRMLDLAAKGGLEVGLEFDFLAEAEKILDAESKH